MPAINTPTYMRLREQLRSDIVSGIWRLGSHITLAELAAHYQVSANPVREALLQLQGEGVVAMRMNRGAVIPLVDEKYIDHLYRLRGAIQVMLSRDAARLATPTQVETMLALCANYEQAASAAEVNRCVAANRELHGFIDAIAGNTMATELLEGRSALVDAFRLQVGYGTGRLDTVVTQHRQLVDAITAGDPDAAARASLEHTDSSRLDLLAACKALTP
jgi:DNA-binding GntR family transcriptional regulator